MMHIYADALRKAVALQVAILELHDSPLGETYAIEGLDTCMKELTRSIKTLKREM